MSKSKDNILIFGRGQIGNFLNDFFSANDTYSVKLSSVDITKEDRVNAELENFKPSVVLNPAGKTNLEWCYNNKLAAFKVNALAANFLAEECAKRNIYFIHFSSGCIFQSKDVKDVKTETSIPEPRSYYAMTKAWSEQLIAYRKPDNFKYAILRPRQTISSQVSPMNMLVKFLTFQKFVDTPNTGVIVEDLMQWIKIIIERRATGIINVANDGYSSPYEIGLLIKKHILPELTVEKISKSELDSMLDEIRVDTILSVDKLKSIVGKENVRSYSEALEDVIIKLKKNIKAMDKAELKKALQKSEEIMKKKAEPNDIFWNLLN